MIAILFLIVVTLTTILAGNQEGEGYYLTMFNQSTGIYYEYKGGMKISASNWRVAVFLNTDQQLEWLQEINKKISRIYGNCPLQLPGCTAYIKEFNWEDSQDTAKDLQDEFIIELAELKRVNHISPIRTQGNTRVRRRVPLLGVLGRIAGPIVGVLSYEDGEQIQAQIEELNSAEANLSHLIGKQTHVVRAQLDTLYKRAEIQENNIRTIGEQLSNLTELIKKSHQGAAHETFYRDLNNLLNKIKTQLRHNIKAGSRMIEVIRSARKGQMHPALISIKQIMPILRDIQDHQPSVSIPVRGPEYSLEEIIRISKTSILLEEGHLKILIDIPLLEKTDYTLYQLHSFPVFQEIFGNQTGRISIKSKYAYIAVDDASRTYIPMKQEELDMCRKISDYSLCSSGMAIYEVHGKPSCEIQLLLNPTVEAMRKCNIQLEYGKTYQWTKLDSIGGWLYSVKDPTNLNVRCPPSAGSQLKINGMGLLQLAPGCYAKNSDVTITSIPKAEGTTEIIYEAELGIDLDVLSPAIAEAKISRLKNTKEIVAEEKEFFKNSQTLDDLEQQLNEFSLRRLEKSQHQYWMKGTYLGIGIVLLTIVAYFLFRRYTTVHAKRVLIGEVPTPSRFYLPRMTERLNLKRASAPSIRQDQEAYASLPPRTETPSVIPRKMTSSNIVKENLKQTTCKTVSPLEDSASKSPDAIPGTSEDNKEDPQKLPGRSGRNYPQIPVQDFPPY